jgi:hypothetical protein
MSYENTERELEAMHEFIEDNYDPDYGWIDQWDQENSKYLLDQWIQETEEAGLR